MEDIIKKIRDMDIVGNIFPFIGNSRLSKKIMKKINIIYDMDPNDIDLQHLNWAGNLLKVPLQIVEKTYHEALERKKTIEDKAKINIFGVTIFISLITALSTSIVALYSQLENDIFKYMLFIMGIVAIFYMMCGGLLALEVLMNKNTVYHINEDEQIIKKNLRKKIYGKLIDLNGYYNIIRNNYINSSYQCIRNALYILLVIFCINLLPCLNNAASEEKKKLEELNDQITDLKYDVKHTKEEIEDKNKEIEKIQNNINELQEENNLMNIRIQEYEEKVQDKSSTYK